MLGRRLKSKLFQWLHKRTRKHARTHARTHACTRRHTHTHTHTHADPSLPSALASSNQFLSNFIDIAVVVKSRANASPSVFIIILTSPSTLFIVFYTQEREQEEMKR